MRKKAAQSTSLLRGRAAPISTVIPELLVDSLAGGGSKHAVTRLSTTRRCPSPVARARALEVSVRLVGELVVGQDLLALHLLLALLGLLRLPVAPQVLDLLFQVQVRVVVLADAHPALPQAEVLRVHRDAVVLRLAALEDVPPPALLLLEVQARRVRQPQPRHDHARQAEPGDHVEAHLRVDVVVQHRGEQRARLAHARREAVRRRADGRGEHLGGDQEGDGVGAELVEEGGQVVHGLEGVDALGRGVVVELEGRDDKGQEAHEEADLLHVLAAVQLVVDQEGRQVVAGEGDQDVVQVPDPVGHDRLGVVADDLDELRLEQLVAVEEDVVAEPAAGRGQETPAKVLEGQAQRVDVVAGDLVLLLGDLQLPRCLGHLVGTVVGEPEGSDGGDGEGQAEDDLSGLRAVRAVALTVVEDEQQDDQQGLVG